MAAVTRPKSRASSTALKEYLDSSKRLTRVVGPVTRHLLTRPPEDRPRDVLHPSEIIGSDWCQRAAYFELLRVAPASKPVAPHLRLQLVFDEGHSIHRKWQAYLREMGVLFGLWRCLVCEAAWQGISPTECPQCHARGLFVAYAEVPLRWDPLRIAGHADGWVVGLGDPFLIEIKSLGPGTLRLGAPELWRKGEGDLEKVWRMVTRPMRSHRRQAQLYLTLVNWMAEAGLFPKELAPKEIVFIYELKSNNDYREFSVFWDPDTVEDVVEDVKDLIYAVETGEVPECTVNRGEDCAKCRVFEGATA